jgi:hypothetical protein
MAFNQLDYNELKRKAEKVYFDMYEAQDMENPSVTTRLDRVERVVEDIKALKWAVFIAVLAMIGDMISQHVKF